TTPASVTLIVYDSGAPPGTSSRRGAMPSPRRRGAPAPAVTRRGWGTSGSGLAKTMNKIYRAAAIGNRGRGNRMPEGGRSGQRATPRDKSRGHGDDGKAQAHPDEVHHPPAHRGARVNEQLDDRADEGVHVQHGPRREEKRPHHEGEHRRTDAHDEGPRRRPAGEAPETQGGK